jgi:hypothetical protein
VKACKEIGSPWVAPRIAHQVILHNAARVDCTFPVRPLLDIGGSPGFWNILVTLQTARGTHIPVVEVGWPYIGFDKRFCRKLPLPS